MIYDTNNIYVVMIKINQKLKKEKDPSSINIKLTKFFNTLLNLHNIFLLLQYIYFKRAHHLNISFDIWSIVLFPP